jgi:site-specific DNA recombinase
MARSREEWIPIRVPQIVPKTTWDQVQAQLDMNKKYASRNNQRNFYLLRGLLVCGACGRTLTGRTYANGTVRYFCTNQGTSRSLAAPCSSAPMDGKTIEPLIWQAVAELLANPPLILDYYLSRQEESEAVPPELKRVRKELVQVEKQDQRLLDAYQAEIIQLDELASRRQALAQHRLVLENRLSELEQLIQQQARQEALASEITAFCDNINSMLHSPTPEQKQHVLRLVVDHIFVGKEQLIIKHVIPSADDRRLYTQRSNTN